MAVKTMGIMLTNIKCDMIYLVYIKFGIIFAVSIKTNT